METVARPLSKRDWSVSLPASPFAWVVAVVVAAVAVLILYPLVVMLGRLFFGEGGLGFGAFGAALAEPALGAVLLNTTIFVACSGVAALVIGAAIAWLNERTDAGFGWVADLLPVLPLLVPPIAGTIGWVFLLSPAAGLLNGALRSLLGGFGIDLQEGPINIYTFAGMIFINTLYLVPYVYLVVAAALRNLDPALEEAARISGSGPLATLRRVTLPAVTPALGAAALLVMITSFSLFSVPVIIGTPPNIEVLSVRIFRLINASFPPRIDVALVLGFFMMAIVQVAILLQGLIARSGHHATIGGRGTRATQVELGRWRWPARLLMAGYLVSTTILPLAGLLLVSMQPFWTPAVNWSRLGLENYYVVLLDNRVTSSALQNSLFLGAAGATAAMLTAAVLALFIQRSNAVSGQLVNNLTALPATIPHIVLGVAFLIALGGAPFNLHGTWLLLLLAYFVLYVPQAARSADAAIHQVGRELAEASQICGAPPGRTFVQIILPLMLPGLVAGWVIVFVHIVGEVTASAMIAGVGNAVVGPVLLDLWENGTFPQLAALALILSLLNTTVVLAVLRFARGSFNARVS